MGKLFKERKYSREETIRGNTVCLIVELPSNRIPKLLSQYELRFKLRIEKFHTIFINVTDAKNLCHAFGDTRTGPQQVMADT